MLQNLHNPNYFPERAASRHPGTVKIRQNNRPKIKLILKNQNAALRRIKKGIFYHPQNGEQLMIEGKRFRNSVIPISTIK